MTNNAIIKSGNAADLMLTPEARRQAVLARVRALKEQGATYTPFEGGVNYIRFDGNTGDCSFGRDQREIPKGQRFAVPLDFCTHGVAEWRSQKKVQELAVKYIEGAAPSVPKGEPLQGTLPKPHHRDGWGPFITIRMTGVGGDLDRVELEMDCSNESKINAAMDLLGQMTAMCDTPYGEEGYFNAIIELEKGSFWSKANSKDVYFPVFKIVGWTNGFEIKELGAAALAAPGKAGSEDNQNWIDDDAAASSMLDD